MELLYFHLTVIVQLISVITSAACLAVYLVSHRRTFLFAFCGFLFYFIDVSLIFQDEFVSIATNLESDPLYLTLRSLGSMVSGGGIYISLWLLVCDFVGENGRRFLLSPARYSSQEALPRSSSFLRALLPASPSIPCERCFCSG